MPPWRRVRDNQCRDVDKSQLSVKDGVVSGGGKRISYGELVQGQQLKLEIPVSGNLTSMFGLTVTGDPPTKPVSQYTIIGKDHANTVTPAKVAGKETWVTDIRLPNMLHGRVVHPKTARPWTTSWSGSTRARDTTGA